MADSSIRRVTLLGATGTIGRATLSVVDTAPDQFHMVGLTAHSAAAELAELARQYRPQLVALADDSAMTRAAWHTAVAGDDFLQTLPIDFGDAAVARVAMQPTDRLVVGIVGIDALPAVWQGLTSQLATGNAIFKMALANKESVVAAGHLLLADGRHRAAIIPLDSEHNAIFQCLLGQDKAAVRHITLTASGGPFWQRDAASFATISVAEALNHPRWKMGKKISIDSATLFNKALEIIEASYLFGMGEEHIRVFIHPQSVIHSLVGFADGSQLAQLGPADMRVPIAFALGFPQRLVIDSAARDFAALDLLAMGRFDFFAPDDGKFKSLNLARAALRHGGAAPLVLNSSNEVLVESFLQGIIPFTAIEKGVATMLDQPIPRAGSDVASVMALDKEIKIKTRAMVQQQY